MKLEELVQVSASVAATAGRLEKISRLASLLTRLSPEEVPIAVGFLIGWPKQGRLRVGWASVSAARENAPAPAATLELGDVDRVFDELLTARGKNSASERARLLGDLLRRATLEEQNFLGNLIVGEVRQG